MSFYKRKPPRVCAYWFILDGQLTQCLKNTAPDKTYCPECAEKARPVHAQPRSFPLGGKYGI